MRNSKLKLCRIMSLLLSVLIIVCIPSFSAYAASAVSVSKTSISVGIDELASVYKLIQDSNKENKTYTYSSSNKKVAAISKKGNVWADPKELQKSPLKTVKRKL